MFVAKKTQTPEYPNGKADVLKNAELSTDYIWLV